jgi:SAM-dependent methyltransferase
MLGRYYGSSYYSYQGRGRSRPKQAVWDLLRDLSGKPVVGILPRLKFDIDVVPGPGLSVVDVGCGYGDLLIYLRARGCEVQGVEFDSLAAEAGARYGIPIHVGPLDELKLRSRSIDVVVFQHSLEHLPDVRPVLAEAARILRPDGELHIAVPNGEAAGLRLQRAAWGCLFAPMHFWYFDEASLTSLLESIGFKVMRTRYRTIWVNHRNLWRSELPCVGLRLAGHVGRLLGAHLRPRSGDILKLVASRV